MQQADFVPNMGGGGDAPEKGGAKFPVNITLFDPYAALNDIDLMVYQAGTLIDVVSEMLGAMRAQMGNAARPACPQILSEFGMVSERGEALLSIARDKMDEIGRLSDVEHSGLVRMGVRKLSA